jgi:hypothetical protein
MLALSRALGGQLATLLASQGGGALSGGLRAAAALSGTRLFSAQPSPADLERAAVSRVLLQASRRGPAAARAALACPGDFTGHSPRCPVPRRPACG